jgi:ComF family protein
VDYGFPWDHLINEFKYQARPELARALAELLSAAVAQAAQALPDAVLPMPLAPQRLAQRGYNQAWELARRVAAAVDRPAWPSGLQRPLDTSPQAGLGRTARQHNLRTAFMVEPGQRPALAGRRIALVDDVMTTGASVREAAAALLRAGAAAVDVWVLARTPEMPAS